LDLLGVAARDGGNDVGVVNTALHPVHIAPVFQPLRPEYLPAVETYLVQNRRIPVALVLEIVDGVDDARTTPPQQIRVTGGQEGGTGRRLPVVEVEDVGREAEHWQHFKQRTAEEDEAPLLVALVESKVETPMHTKELFIFQKIDLH